MDACMDQIVDEVPAQNIPFNRTSDTPRPLPQLAHDRMEPPALAGISYLLGDDQQSGKLLLRCILVPLCCVTLRLIFVFHVEPPER